MGRIMTMFMTIVEARERRECCAGIEGAATGPFQAPNAPASSSELPGNGRRNGQCAKAARGAKLRCWRVGGQKGEAWIKCALLTRIEGGRVDSLGIDGRTLSAVRLGGIHSGGRRCDVARQAAEETWRKLCPAERRVLI